MQSLKFYASLLRLNIRSAFAAGLWVQMFFMVLNNVIFWVIWKIFFQTFEQINGWRLPEVTLMYATTQLAWGLKIVAFGGTRNLARVISDGELDGYLLQPRHPLLHVATTRSFPSGWGDIASGVGLAAISGALSLWTTPVYIFAVLCAALTFLAAEVILHSLAFWFGPTNTLSRQMTEYIIMLSCYPQNIYSGWLRIVTYVVLPAAVIGLLPVELVRGSVSSGLLMIALTTFFTSAALGAFHAGLRHRMSG